MRFAKEGLTVALMGNGGSGKTSMSEFFSTGKFHKSRTYSPTPAAVLTEVTMKTNHGGIDFTIVDMNGQDSNPIALDDALERSSCTMLAGRQIDDLKHVCVGEDARAESRKHGRKYPDIQHVSMSVKSPEEFGSCLVPLRMLARQITGLEDLEFLG